MTYDSSPALEVIIKTVSIAKENISMFIRELVKANASAVSQKEVTLREVEQQILIYGTHTLIIKQPVH